MLPPRTRELSGNCTPCSTLRAADFLARSGLTTELRGIGPAQNTRAGHPTDGPITSGLSVIVAEAPANLDGRRRDLIGPARFERAKLLVRSRLGRLGFSRKPLHGLPSIVGVKCSDGLGFIRGVFRRQIDQAFRSDRRRVAPFGGQNWCIWQERTGQLSAGRLTMST
jgi:hypothetical protein